MSINTLFGFLIGLGIFIYSILSSTKDYKIFLDLAALAIVLGGTIAATFISFQYIEVKRIFKSVWHIFKSERGEVDFQDYIHKFCNWGEKIRANGISTIEGDYENMANCFLKDGLEMLINGYTKEDIVENLESSIGAYIEKSEADASLFNYMAAAGPAFGLVGTLIGLIIMLKAIGSDTASLGPAMSIALVCTLYGVIFSNLIFQPISEKITRKLETEVQVRLLQLKGVILLHEKTHPLMIQDKLNALIPPRLRVKKINK